MRLATWQLVSVLALFYTAVVIVATWPYFLSFKDTLPSNTDPTQHLWIMNWYKSCFLQGKLPFFCADLQYPTGVPLGLFSPLHLQSALFLPLSIATGNDFLSYNLIWMIGLVTTGLGVFALSWQATGHRAASAMGGMLAVLSGPVMLHAHAHLELIYVGTIALFLAAWIRFLDRPSWVRLALATTGYVLAGASAAYFVVLTIMPAAWVVAYRLVQLARREGRSAVIERLKWLAYFTVATLPFVALLMANQLWAITHGSVMTRSTADFTNINANAPFWGYFIPSSYHAIASSFLPVDIWGYIQSQYCLNIIERASYLGVVTLLLMHHALIHRAKIRGARIWWSLFAVVVVLGMGCYAWLGPIKVSLPSLWLWEAFPPFRLLRLPARFHLLAVIPAAVLAALGLSQLLDGVRRRTTRVAILVAVTVISIIDLGQFSYQLTYKLPPMPAGYSWLKQRDPSATILEWPILGVGTGDRTYWSNLHGIKTSEGYSGLINMPFLYRIWTLSPLLAMAQPDFLSNPQATSFGFIEDARFHDYLWLYLKANDYRYLVIHEDPVKVWIHPFAQARLREQLGGSKVFEDSQMMVFEQARLPMPSRPVLVCTEGWKSSAAYQMPLRYGVAKVARMTIFNPTPSVPLVLDLNAAACLNPKTARLMDGSRELARWTIEPGETTPHASPPFHLPAGIHELTLESDCESVPSNPINFMDEVKTPYSLRIGGIRLRNVP